MPSIAILGASNDRHKYGNRAVRAYVAQGWTVYPINPRESSIEGVPAYPSIADIPSPVDRVTLYLPPEVGITLLPAIRARGAKEVWVNPGSGSPELLALAENLGLVTIEACSIVAASDHPESNSIDE